MRASAEHGYPHVTGLSVSCCLRLPAHFFCCDGFVASLSTEKELQLFCVGFVFQHIFYGVWLPLGPARLASLLGHQLLKVLGRFVL